SGKRIRFARRSEHRESAGALGEQPFAMRNEPLFVDRQIAVKRCERGHQDAARISVHAHRSLLGRFAVVTEPLYARDLLNFSLLSDIPDVVTAPSLSNFGTGDHCSVTHLCKA